MKDRKVDKWREKSKLLHQKLDPLKISHYTIRYDTHPVELLLGKVYLLSQLVYLLPSSLHVVADLCLTLLHLVQLPPLGVSLKNLRTLN